MANNYSQASFIAPCSKDAAEYVLETSFVTEGNNYYEFNPGWGGLWVYQDEAFDIDEAVQVVQELLNFDNDTTTMVRIEVAFTCSKPRIDNFGGAVALVTATNDYRMTTSDWMPILL